MTAERHGRVQSTLLFIFGRLQVQNPSWSSVVPIEFFFWRFSLVYAARFNVGPQISTRRLPATRILNSTSANHPVLQHHTIAASHRVIKQATNK